MVQETKLENLTLEIKNVLAAKYSSLMREYSVLAVGGGLEIILGIRVKRNTLELGIDQ